MIKTYKTFMRNSSEEIIEKKSRFIGHAAYIATQDEAQGFINSVKRTNHTANHNVFAYRLEGTTILERQSDDGEPGGTAGMPVLDILRKAEIVNGIIVVTRYFGGTLLGTGGLVRAYSKAAKACMEAANVIEKQLFTSIAVQVDYHLSGKLQHEFMIQNIIVDDIIYTDKVEFKLFIENGTEERIIKQINDSTGANAAILLGGNIYGCVIDGKFILL